MVVDGERLPDGCSLTSPQTLLLFLVMDKVSCTIQANYDQDGLTTA
jgi:hypothetical protein